MVNKSALAKTIAVWTVIVAVLVGGCFIPYIVATVLAWGLATTVISSLIYITYCIFDDSGYDYYGWCDEY